MLQKPDQFSLERPVVSALVQGKVHRRPAHLFSHFEILHTVIDQYTGSGRPAVGLHYHFIDLPLWFAVAQIEGVMQMCSALLEAVP